MGEQAAQAQSVRVFVVSQSSAERSLSGVKIAANQEGFLVLGAMMLAKALTNVKAYQ
jgi:hypothetical protein